MRLILCLFFILLTSFTSIQSQIKLISEGNVFSMIIFPIAGDSSLYISREFDNKNYCIEKIYRKHKIVSQIRINYFNSSKGKENHKFSYDEFYYENNEVVELRENYSCEIYKPSERTLFVNDSLTYKLYYYKNGLLEYCGFERGSCYYGRGFDFDTLNKTYWTGLYSDRAKFDTIEKIINGEKTFVVSKTCLNDSIGTWYKYSCNNEIIDSAHCKINNLRNVLHKTHSR